MQSWNLSTLKNISLSRCTGRFCISNGISSIVMLYLAVLVLWFYYPYLAFYYLLYLREYLETSPIVHRKNSSSKKAIDEAKLISEIATLCIASNRLQTLSIFFYKFLRTYNTYCASSLSCQFIFQNSFDRIIIVTRFTRIFTKIYLHIKRSKQSAATYNSRRFDLKQEATLVRPSTAQHEHTLVYSTSLATSTSRFFSDKSAAPGNSVSPFDV